MPVHLFVILVSEFLSSQPSFNGVDMGGGPQSYELAVDYKDSVKSRNRQRPSRKQLLEMPATLTTKTSTVRPLYWSTTVHYYRNLK